MEIIEQQRDVIRSLRIPTVVQNASFVTFIPNLSMKVWVPAPCRSRDRFQDTAISPGYGWYSGLKKIFFPTCQGSGSYTTSPSGCIPRITHGDQSAIYVVIFSKSSSGLDMRFVAPINFPSLEKPAMRYQPHRPLFNVLKDITHYRYFITVEPLQVVLITHIFHDNRLEGCRIGQINYSLSVERDHVNSPGKTAHTHEHRLRLRAVDPSNTILAAPADITTSIAARL